MSRTHYAHGEREVANRFPGLVGSLGGHRYVLLGFGVNDSSIRPQHRRFLDDVVERYQLAASNPLGQVELIEGHADAVQRAGGNHELGALRAESVRQALTDRHVPRSGFGIVRAADAGQNLATNDTPEGRLANRGVLLQISVLNPPRRLDPIPVPPVVPPAHHGSRRWSLQSLGSIVIARLLAGGASNFILRNDETGEQRNCIFAGAGFGGGARTPRVPWMRWLRRITRGIHMPARTGISVPSWSSFRTSRGVTMSDFTCSAVMATAGVGIIIGGYSVGGFGLNTNFGIDADEPAFHGIAGRQWLDVGGFQVAGGLGTEASALVGMFTVAG